MCAISPSNASQTASVIPTWLSEDNSQYRVWLRGGALHIIPIPRTPSELLTIPARLTPENGLRFLRSHGAAAFTLAAPVVQRRLQKRLAPHPNETLEHNRVWRRCLLPRAVAQVVRYVCVCESTEGPCFTFSSALCFLVIHSLTIIFALFS